MGSVSIFALRTSIFVVTFAVSIVRADTGVDVAHLQQRVQALQERINELAGEGNLLDTLYFAWSDRPYARATLAILIKVAATLDREVDCRSHGNGKIDDATVESMLQWADGAVERVIRAEPSKDFRPHRMRLTWEQLGDRRGVPPLFAFFDVPRTTPDCEFIGDPDLLACLGYRVYPWAVFTTETPWRRAEVLGLLAVDVFPDLPPGWRLSGLLWEDTQSTWMESRRFVAGLPLAFLFLRHPATNRKDFALPAIMDVPSGEPFADALARRAAVRGVFACARYAVDRWTPPSPRSTIPNRLAELSANMWAEALDGQFLAIMGGLRNVHEGEQPGSCPHCPGGSPAGAAHPETSLLVDPAQVETITHSALDLLRHGDRFRAFEEVVSLAFVVGREAIAYEPPVSNGDSGTDAWATWVRPIWETLVSRQVRFDVVPDSVDPTSLRERYSVVIPLERPTDGQTEALIGKIERRLAQVEDHVYRLTARELDGMIAADMYVRAGRTPEGKACAAVVNLTDRLRVLKLRGRPEIGPSHDVIADQPIPEPGRRLEFAPWQVRLLWPRE